MGFFLRTTFFSAGPSVLCFHPEQDPITIPCLRPPRTGLTTFFLRRAYGLLWFRRVTFLSPRMRYFAGLFPLARQVSDGHFVFSQTFFLGARVPFPFRHGHFVNKPIFRRLPNSLRITSHAHLLIGSSLLVFQTVSTEVLSFSPQPKDKSFPYLLKRTFFPPATIFFCTLCSENSPYHTYGSFSLVWLRK